MLSQKCIRLLLQDFLAATKKLNEKTRWSMTVKAFFLPASLQYYLKLFMIKKIIFIITHPNFSTALNFWVCCLQYVFFVDHTISNK